MLTKMLYTGESKHQQHANTLASYTSLYSSSLEGKNLFSGRLIFHICYISLSIHLKYSINILNILPTLFLLLPS